MSDGGRSPLEALRKKILDWIDDRCERAVTARKAELLGSVTGSVLELGPGPGVSFGYYPKGIRWTGIEPDESLHPALREAARRHGIGVELREVVGHRLDVEDASMDVVVSSFALCTVPDPAETLREVLRVLKPGGRFVFMEHVAAPPGTLLRRLQRAAGPLWARLAPGCLLDRDSLTAIQQAGFRQLDHQAFDIPVLLLRPHIAGIAVK